MHAVAGVVKRCDESSPACMRGPQTMPGHAVNTLKSTESYYVHQVFFYEQVHRNRPVKFYPWLTLITEQIRNPNQKPQFKAVSLAVSPDHLERLGRNKKCLNAVQMIWWPAN
jgi:hypothetical protein